MNFKVLIFLLAVAILSTQSLDFTKKILRQNWKMIPNSCPGTFQSFNNKEFNVTVPSTLHLNLEKANQIPNPYFGENLKALTSLSDCSVNFVTNISVDKELSQYSKITLVFEGIDTYSEIYLNNVLLGKTQNAFLKYQYSVKEHLKQGNNELKVKIASPKPHDATQQRKDRMPFDYAQTRKACYQYSWDWAPYMNTMGIWLPVSLVFYDEAKIDYSWFRIQHLTKQKAILDILIALDGVQGNQNLISKGLTAKVVRLDNKEQREFILKSKYNNIKWQISQPKLWWPNNLGEPHVYQFQILLLKNSQILDRKRTVTGLRTVQHNHEGTNFQISVNGHLVYCKGANYVPLDMMYPRLINPDFNPHYTIEKMFDDIVQSNYNMIRLWGGGQYETELFYQLASKKGIMIFHDFMFSDSIYPGTDEFIENVKQQIVYQVRRLRNYPAIVLWSGNNQILQGIQSWGWGQPRYRDNYNLLFGKVIPDILQIEHNLPYIESSPSRGVGNAGFQQGGDIHYWGVWAAGSPFESYETALGGFNSEFGTQSLPVWETIQQFTLPADRTYDSPKMLFHEKHNSRFNTLRSYMSRYSQKSLNFEMEAYSSGLVHAYAMEIAIRAQRSSKPRSMGTLYWMLNDAWPAVSWSSIDYYGRWKAVQYYAKKLYKDIILLYHGHKNKIVAINDKLVPIKANYIIEITQFNGTVQFSERGFLQLKPNEKRQLISLDPKHFVGKEGFSFVYTEIIYGVKQGNRSSLVTFFKPFKELMLEQGELTVHFLYGTNEIQFSSNYLIKNLYISGTQYIKFSDNYFDVVPNKKIKIAVMNPQIPLQTLKNQLKFNSYRQVYDPSPLTVKFQN